MCVQRFDDSRNSAIHTTYRISLRSSSMPEPRDPLLKVLIDLFGTFLTTDTAVEVFGWSPLAGEPAEETVGAQKFKGFYLGRGPRGGPHSNDPSAGSPTERLSSTAFRRRPDHILSSARAPPTTIWPVNSIRGAGSPRAR
jgi:hypothetical protein